MRSILFYPRLAVSGMRRNKILYIPYLLASSLIVMLFYILSSMTWIVSNSTIKGAEQISILLMLSSIVCGLLTVLILFYLNGYVIKQRSREFGLYSVLGLGKWNLCLLIFWEILFSCIGSLICGILAGAVFSQLMYLLLLNITHLPVDLEMWVPMGAVNITVTLFLVAWGIVLLRNVIRIFRSDPIEILRRTSQGETEPRSRWFLAGIGICTLIAGYALALTVQEPFMVLAIFLPATILVIIATYCIFSAVSIVVLKAMRRNRKFYYQPDNFINVSGMLYRMRQNAVGLANICILASAVLVTISSCVCLYIGEEDMLNALYLKEASVTVYRNADENVLEPDLLGTVEKVAQSYDLDMTSSIKATKHLAFVHQQGNTISSTSSNEQVNQALEYRLLEDLNAATGSSYALSDHQILIYHGKDFPEGSTLQIDGSDFTVVTLPESDSVNAYLRQTDAPTQPILFFQDQEDLIRAIQNDPIATVSYTLWFDYDLKSVNADLFPQALTEHLRQTEGAYGSQFKSEARTDFYRVYGSLLFVGLFFVALFLITTVLIIYYKQITEGYEDRQRFQIMRQIGLTDAEVRTSIRRQVQMVFFLPILVALIHIAFAFPALQKILTLFEMHNTPLFIGCVAVSALVFLGFYTGVYLITARTYYHIVTSVPQS